MTEIDVVNYLTEINNELDNTYKLYQDLLYSIKNNSFIKVLKRIAFGFRTFRRFIY